MRRAARTDLAHAEIRDGLRRAGYFVADTSKLGSGFPDMVVESKAGDPVYVLLEVKSPGGKLTPDEEKFHKQSRGPLKIVYSLEGALLIMEEYDKVRFD